MLLYFLKAQMTIKKPYFGSNAGWVNMQEWQSAQQVYRWVNMQE
jgi:hypothetical protein